MIVRIQFVERENSKTIYSWCLFNVESNGMKIGTLFEKIYDGSISCGRGLSLKNFNNENVEASVYSGHKKNPSLSDLMPAPLELSLSDLKENDCALFIQFELLPVITAPGVEGNSETSSNLSEDLTQSEELDSVTNVLMNRRNHYPEENPNTKYGDIKQYNALVNFLKQKKFGVKGTELPDYEDFTRLLSSLLWEVDPHYKKLCERGGRFPNEMQSFLGYNVPKEHSHPVKRTVRGYVY